MRKVNLAVLVTDVYPHTMTLPLMGRCYRSITTRFLAGHALDGLQCEVSGWATATAVIRRKKETNIFVVVVTLSIIWCLVYCVCND